jgi:hypothetical protein
MNIEGILRDFDIQAAIKSTGYTGRTIEECRLCVAELLIKAASGSRNGHTEEAFLSCFNLMKKDRTPNWLGRKFISAMFYKHSNNRPPSFDLMKEFRK